MLIKNQAPAVPAMPPCSPLLFSGKPSYTASRAADLISNNTSNGSVNESQFRECKSRIKCVLVGDGAVGKTSLVVSYTTNGYPTEYVPTAYDNYNVVVMVDGCPTRLQLCDTAGQDDFDSLRPLCYPGSDVFLLCFSVVSPTSFSNVSDKWVPEIRRHCPTAPIVLVGTQNDLRSDVKVLIELAHYRELPVSEHEARKLAQQIGAVCYIESSALTQKNLKEVFDQAIISGLEAHSAVPLTTRKTKRRKEVAYTEILEEDEDRRRKKGGGWRKLWCFS